MNATTARYLSDLTSEFYRHMSESFASTRQNAWPGWHRVAKLANLGAIVDERGSAHVLDLACGNLRFANYVWALCPQAHVWAVDNCDDLVARGARCADGSPLGGLTFEHLDISGELLDGRNLCETFATPPCDLGVCFGFMHHVPMPQHRANVLEAIVQHTRPGGLVAVSFWQFEHDARILAKAQALEDTGDYLLGWQGRNDVRRYCHSFTDEELDELVASVGTLAREVGRYSADGRSGDLNRYLLLRRN